MITREDWQALLPQVERLPAEVRIGQMIWAGLNATTVDKEFVQTLAKYPFGNIGLFSYNISTPQQVASLCRDIQQVVQKATGGIECTIAVDEEGGYSSQFTTGVTQIPGSLAIGAANNAQAAFGCGQMLGQELNAMGFTLTWAPVLDLCRGGQGNLIGVRSFGTNPLAVAQMGSAFAAGLNAGGVGAAFKHFPGHGVFSIGARPDTPENHAGLNELLAGDALPFIEVVKTNPDAMMIGHIVMPNVTGDALPIALSPLLLTDILREKIGFEGVAIATTPVTEEFTLKRAACMAIQAGADMMVLCDSRHHQILVYNALLAMLRGGRLKEEQVNRSVARILAMKRAAAGYRTQSAQGSGMLKAGTVRSVCDASVTLHRDPGGLIPLQPEKHRRLLVVEPLSEVFPNADRAAQLDCNLSSFLTHEGYDVTVVKAALNLPDVQRDTILKTVAECDIAVVGSINSNEFPAYAALLRQLCEKLPTIVVSLRFPYEVQTLPGTATVLSAYSIIDASMDAAARVISGRLQPSGINPVGE